MGRRTDAAGLTKAAAMRHNKAMSNWMSRLFSRPADHSPSAICPEGSFYAIGDVHGRDDLLGRLLSSLDPALPVVCVGDYVDRGEESAAVLRRLSQSSYTCLMGNHEEMLLRFLDDAEAEGRRWLQNGGLQTLASYGISGVTPLSTPEALRTAAMDLKTAMGDDLIAWLRERPQWFRNGNVFVVHAGADPARPIAEQSRSLTWGHPSFQTSPRRDGLWIVHGHTIVEAANAKSGRIAIDTGAYATGRLTAARIDVGAVTFADTAASSPDAV